MTHRLHRREVYVETMEIREHVHDGIGAARCAECKGDDD